jgi:hypothetical protein
MLMFLVVLLIALWLLGMVTTTTLGGWLHILLVIAIIFLLIRVIRGHRYRVQGFRSRFRGSTGSEGSGSNR